MPSASKPWVALATLALAACQDGVRDVEPAYELEVDVSTYNKELQLLADGVVEAPTSREGLTDQYRILRTSPSLEEALPVRLQSASAGSVLDAMAIAPGSVCAEVCGECVEYGTIVGEMTSVGIAADGTLLDSHEVGGCIACAGTKGRRTGCP